MKENLKDSVIRGVTWTGISRFLTQTIQLFTTIILARLLFPKDFGVVGIAGMFIQLESTLNRMGLPSAIIHKENLDDEHLSSVFWANIVASLVLCSVTILMSGLIASFFRDNLVKFVLIALSFMFIGGSFQGVQNALFAKKLEFKKLAFVSISEILSNGIVSVLLAILQFGVWSLVWGRLCGVITGAIVTWIMSSWRPKFVFVLPKFKELFNFGINVMGVNMLDCAYVNVDRLIVGRFLGVAPLGVYTMAYNFVTLPQRKFSSIITEVAFPAFSKIQKDNDKIARNYLKMLHYISVVSFPLLSGLLIVAPEFVKSLLGEKWLGIIMPLQIMCIAGIVKSIGATAGSLFYSKGRPDLELKLNIVAISTLIPMLIWGAKGGIIMVAMVVAMHSLMLGYISFSFISKLIQVKWINILKSLFPATFLSFAMVVVLIIYRFGFQLILRNETILLISSICIGAFVYLFLFVKFYKETFEKTVKGLIRRMLLKAPKETGIENIPF